MTNGGAILGQIATRLAGAAMAGSGMAGALGNNPYVRLGVTNMGGPGKTPALRFGNFVSDWGKWLSRVDLRPGQVFSKTAPNAVKQIQQCLR